MSFLTLGFKKEVGVAAVVVVPVVVAAAAAVAGALVSFSSVNRASKAENAKKWLRWWWQWHWH